MERILYIIILLCAFGMGGLFTYHYFFTRADSILIIMAILFFLMGIWVYRLYISNTIAE